MHYFVTGDLHGDFNALFYHSLRCPNSKIFVCGDCGFGFSKPNFYRDLFQKKNEKLKQISTHIYMIRGNHDDPSYFTNKDFLQFSNIHLLDDYSIVDDHILVIGGAISNDRLTRVNGETKISCSGKVKYTNKTIYWKDEGIVQKTPEELNQLTGIDVILSHECPDIVNIKKSSDDYYMQMDPDLENDVKKGKRYLTQVYNNIRPKYWFFGHYHTNYEEMICDTKFKCCDMSDHFTVLLNEFEI